MDGSARDRYPALALQRGMIMGTLRDPRGGVDVQQVTMEWDAPLDREAFAATWQAAIGRHATLRTSFHVHGDDGLEQVVHPTTSFAVRWLDLPADDLDTGGPDGAGDLGGDVADIGDVLPAAVAEVVRADRFEPFDVGAAPLMRITVMTRRGARPYVLISLHHAIIDGRSLRLLLEEVFDEYACRRAGAPPRHPDRRPFSEFVRWWASRDLSAAEAYWKGFLAAPPAARPLPGLLAGGSPARVEPAGGQPACQAEPATAEVALTRAESDRARAACQAAGAGPSTLVNAAWAVLRGAYGGVEDVTFAVTRSCRHGSVPGADEMVGMMINTVPLRLRLNPRWTVRELLADVSARTRRVREHQLAPLGEILSWAGLPPDGALMDSLVAFERQRLHVTLAEGGLEPARRSARVWRLPAYPISLYAFDEPEMRLVAMWDSRRMLDASARRTLAQWRRLVALMAERPDARLCELDPDPGDETRLRAGWNETRRAYPRDACVPDLFAARALARPDAIAVVDGDTRISYAELDRDTDRLARALRRHGAALDEPIAVALPRGHALIRALLAVLKAGAAYLPVDPASPPPRVAAMLAAGGARLALADQRGAARLRGLGPIEVLDVDALATEPEPPASEPLPRVHPLNLAYVSFTSGSTGVPKGVAVPHRAVVRLVSDPGFATLDEGERVLQLAPIAFDASTWEIWGALCTGATLVIAPPDPLDLSALARLLRERDVTAAWLTAGLFGQLVEMDPAALASVRQLLTGGDVVDPGTLRAALAVRGGRPIVNGYGPTENTTFTTCQVIADPGQFGDRVPIGAPVPGTRVHVLDRDGRPAPIGVVGELCAAGDGLARGYRGDAAATARAFTPDPNGRGERLYRTGDLARWRADGVLEFFGRADQQVKIRGFRVEPGEVEAVLKRHPGVAEALVCVRGDGPDRHLVAYVTRAGGADGGGDGTGVGAGGVGGGVGGAGGVAPHPGSLRAHAVASLPDYLVPAAFAVLDRLPLSANGKVDRAALPPDALDAGISGSGSGDGAGFGDVVALGAALGASPAPPSSETERRLAELWLRLLPGEHLRAADIGRDVSFFALGGNSLIAARLMFRVQETFGVQLDLQEFHQRPALAAVAAAIEAARARAGADAATGSASAAPRPVIGRRDRSRHRVDGNVS